jgi:hypothetical protein
MVMIRNRGHALVTLAVLRAAGIASLSAAAAAGATSPTSLTRTLHLLDVAAPIDSFVDLGAPGPTPGDLEIFHDTVWRTTAAQLVTRMGSAPCSRPQLASSWARSSLPCRRSGHQRRAYSRWCPTRPAPQRSSRHRGLRGCRRARHTQLPARRRAVADHAVLSWSRS